MSEDNHLNKRPFQLEDIYDLAGLSGPKLSPKNSHVVCTISLTDKNENSTKNHIALIRIEDKEIRYLAKGSSPEWNPAGSQIAYEAEENGKEGIWIYDLHSDTSRFLVRVYYSNYFIDHYERKNFAWAPDGNSIAYVGTMPFAETDIETKEVREINSLLYKTKGGRGRSFFADKSLTHIWTIPVAGGEPQLMTNDIYNEHSISWSPDGSQIAFISNRSADPDDNQCNDLWTLEIKTGQITRLTNDNGTAFQPCWSPDGNWIAYLGISGKVSTNDSPAEDTHLYIVDMLSCKSRDLTKSFDRRIENLSWNRDTGFIYFTSGNHGTTKLYRSSVPEGNIEPMIAGDISLLEYDVNKDAVAYTATTINRPAELFIMRESSATTMQLTSLNHAIVNNCLLQDAVTYWFSSFDGRAIQGWLMKPVSFNEADKYPLALVIHGGPHNMFGYAFEDRMQILSANGYAVLFINPRGSSGYGQAFSSGNAGDWGGGDYRDLMAGLDHIIENNKWINSEKLFVTGQSYGGYLTNWIITQTNRFKAAVADGGISNLISFAGTSIYHSLIESDFETKIPDRYSLLWQCSPLRNIKNVTTATLFLHGMLDNEVPVSQAEEMYVGLKKSGVQTSMVLYEGEGHGWRPDLKPANRVDLLNRIINWFDSH
ncbi:S9 family peptidase [Flavitalea sp.]|nr:S9 family peptidase [Flavitalea sp.]